MITLCLAYILGQAARGKELAMNVYQIILFLCIALSIDIAAFFLVAAQISRLYSQ